MRFFRSSPRSRLPISLALAVALLPITVPAVLLVTATAAHATDPYSTAVLADSPLSYWRLGETSGTTAVDEQGLANGSISGGVVGGLSGVTPGNTAMFLDDASGTGINASNSAFKTTTSASIEIWIRTTQASGAIFTTNDFGTTALYLEHGSLTAWQQQGDGQNELSSDGNLNDGRWHQIVFVVDNSGTGSLALYVDGTLNDSGSLGGNLGSSITIGYQLNEFCDSNPDCARTLGGAFDEFAYYGSALTATQVARHYAAADLSVQGGPITAAERRGFTNVGSRWICTCSVPAADPVDTSTGNFSETFSDLSIAGRGPGIDWTRTYNSYPGDTVPNGPLGYGWSTAYSASISVVSTTATVTQANGATLTFTESGGVWSAPPRVTSTLEDDGTTWKLTRNKRDILVFDKTTGHLNEIDDLNGYSTTLSYNSGRLNEITDQAGRTLDIAWNGAYIGSLFDFTGRKISYTYDTNHNLTDVTDTRGGDWQFTYDSNHRMLIMRSPRFLHDTTTSPTPVTTNTYDGSGRVSTQTDPIGRETTFDYTTLASDGGVIVTDPLGNENAVYYDANGLMVKQTRGYGSSHPATWTYAYDPYTLGRIATVDPLGNVTQTAYDSNGNVLASSDGLGRTTFYSYDALNDVTSQTDPNAVTTTYTYDTGGHGDLTSQSTPCVNPDTTSCGTQTTSYAHTDTSHPGDVTSTTDPRSKVTTFSYDSFGDLLTSTDALGDETSYTYDALGRQASVVDANGNVTGGNPDLWRTASLHDAAGNTTVTVDANGVPVLDSFTRADSTSSLGSTETGKTWQTPAGTWGINSGFALLEAASGSTNMAVVPTSANGTFAVTEATTQNNTGLVFRESDTSNFWSLRADTTNSTWDLIKTVAGTPTTVATTGTATCCGAGQRPTVIAKNSTITISESGSTPVVVTDSALSTNVKAGIFSAGTGLAAFDDFVEYKNAVADTTTSTYDADGNRSSSTDGDGNTTGYVYDPAEQLTTVNRPDSSALHYTYDDDGNQATYEDGATNVTTYTHTDPAFPAAVTSSEPPVVGTAHVTDYTYDRAGNLADMTDPSMRDTDYVYDAANELTNVNYNSMTMTDVTYSYDADGQRTGKTGGDSGTEAWTYDSLHRLRSSSLGLSTGAVSYGYDLSNNLTTIGYPSSGTVTRTYDDAERLSTIADWQSPTNTTTYTYNPDGTPSVLIYPNGVTSTTSYDNAQQPTEINIAKSGSTLADFAYTFTNGGLLATDTPTGLGSNQTYTYDPLNHMKKSATSVTYTYDAADNLTKIGSSTRQLFNADNQLCWSGPTNGTSCGTTPTSDATYGYDAQGNRTTRTPSSGSGTTYGYNQANQLTQQGVTGAANPTTLYLYDADGLRIRKTAVATSTNTDYVWDTAESPQPLLQETSSGTTTNYIYGLNGTPIEQVIGATTTYLHQDQLGSTRVITNTSGAVAGTYTYDPYGTLATAGHSGTATTNLEFAGQYLDGETGFYYLRNRFYDSSAGQFITRDPYDSSTQEAYGYVSDNPPTNTDNTGLGCNFSATNGAPLGCDRAGDWAQSTPAPTMLPVAYKSGRSLTVAATVWQRPDTRIEVNVATVGDRYEKGNEGVGNFQVYLNGQFKAEGSFFWSGEGGGATVYYPCEVGNWRVEANVSRPGHGSAEADDESFQNYAVQTCNKDELAKECGDNHSAPWWGDIVANL